MMRDYADIVSKIRIAAIGVKKQSNRLTLMQDAADAIEELQAAVPHWISVEERLPEKHKVVLFYTPWNKTNMIGWIDEGGDINLEGYGRCYDFSLIKPSHWMPLPEKPKEE